MQHFFAHRFLARALADFLVVVIDAQERLRQLVERRWWAAQILLKGRHEVPDLIEGERETIKGKRGVCEIAVPKKG
jgi:hypothetical protein